jgi:very-short-patch-repair endonuclease
MTMQFPRLLGEVIPAGFGSDEILFPFQSWAAAHAFKYPPAATDFLSRCRSAAEAYFAREFTLRPHVQFPAGQAGLAIAGDVCLQLQARCGGYWIDAVVSGLRSTLAIEIDGMQFHHLTREQVAADYLRQRRIVLKGHTVIRFTAGEVFVDAAECWRQVDAILAARSRT